MNTIVQLFTGPEAIAAVMAVFGVVLTFIINRVSAAFTLATGINIETKHREALHEAIKSGVESAILHGGATGIETIRAHVVQHARESVPDAIKALSPTDSVMTRLIERYTREALNRLGERK